ncbi:DUF805 domain-containing protein [Sphingomonas sp. LY54]|uniref:DUF805 domain-containing protein n=1 Tax=Sphingomonas sp. LY54 TaxID=3095343 RepID=UPI002D76F470|nr:DUF805 domain-containing protein [Sphingomonas sp. LY54]WRP28629.1 DUF805 domain-containing protein [Sphingomonas sp. LY54]
MEWATLPLKKYAQFEGRSRRKEYWSFFLLMLGVYIVAGMIDGILGLAGMVLGVYGPLSLVAAVALFVPSLAVGVRRLHDTGRSGWWLLIGLIPLVGGLVLLYFMVIEGTPGPNEYGPDPKGGERGTAPGTI